VKKLVIALVFIGLLVALTIPSIYSASPWLTYTLDFLGKDVRGEAEQCGSRRRFISSHNINLCLAAKFYGKKVCPVGQYLDLTENKGVITMQFFFKDEDDKKVQLNVYGGELVAGKGEWLSSSFTIEFLGDPAEILPTKRKRIPIWEGNVDITILCTIEPT